MNATDIQNAENLIILTHKISPLLWLLHSNLHLSQQKTMKVKWFRISLVFTYKKWNTGALHGHLEIQNFPSLLEGLFTRTQLTGLARLLGQTSPWVHMGNFSPVSEMREGQRCWGRVLALNSKNKANKAKHKNLTFAPIIASATLKAVSLQLQCYGMLMTWKIQHPMQDDAIRTARIHSAFILVTGLKCS